MTFSWLLAVAALVSAPPDVRFVSTMEKIRPGAMPAGDAGGRLSAARGECEGLQLLVPPPAEALDIRASPLKGPGGDVAVSLFQVEYVEVQTPSNREGATGLWPDPLVPWARRKVHSSTEARPFVVYLEACVPQGQAPGTYTATVAVRAGGQETRAALELTVAPFELPATSSLATSFGLSLYSLAKGHHLAPESPAAKRLLRDYATALLAHRLSAHGLSMEPPVVRRGARGPRGGAGLEVDFSAYDAEVGPLLDGTVLPSGARATSAELRDVKGLSPEEREAYVRAVAAHFEARGWKAQLFFYAKDEPKPEELAFVRTQAQPLLKARRVPVLVTSPWDVRLQGVAGVLTPTLNCFFPREGPQTCRNVQTSAALRKLLPATARLWWYQSCNSHGCDAKAEAADEVATAYSGWPSYMLDHPAALNRAMGPLAFSQRIDGELYFDTVYAYNAQDPWRSVFAFGGNGDGTLFYPGTPERFGGDAHFPVASLRLKAIRDGLEDYEYLRLLAACGDRPAAEQAAGRLAPRGFEIERSPQVWREVRAGVTRRIIDLQKRGECRGVGPVRGRQ